MGILVSGAERVEQEVEQLKRNFKNFTMEKGAGTGARLGLGGNTTKGFMKSAQTRLELMNRKAQPFLNQLEHDTRTLLHRINVRARMLLLDTIDRTIVELDRARQRLRNSNARTG